MKAQEYKEMTLDELGEHLKERRTELVNQRFEIGSRQLKDHNKLGETKREIARILTVMNEKTTEKSKPKTQLRQGFEGQDENRKLGEKTEESNGKPDNK